MTYIALLRGINVGGNNIIKMADLRESLTKAELEDVSTYIQSGNVIFSAPKTSVSALEKKIENVLAKDFAYTGFVVVISATELKKIIAEAPKDFGSMAEKFRYDVMFLKPPMTPQKAIEDVPQREGVDTKYAGSHAVYFSRLTAEASKSKLSKITGLPVYQHMTIRNWNTTTKLLELAS